ncbi:MAG: ATP-dependent DNA helicase [Chlorobi bacterium]|nr:ATP-dependent DNA helicase [Chlorobiota bacterium]
MDVTSDSGVIDELKNHIALNGYSIIDQDPNNLRVSVDNNIVLIEQTDGLLHIRGKDPLSKLSILKTITGNPHWVDKTFLEALQRTAEQMIKSNDPNAIIELEKRAEEEYVLRYDATPIISVKTDSQFLIITGNSPEWDNQIPNLISAIENQLPELFWILPPEWTVVADPMVYDEDWATPEAHEIEPFEYAMTYIANSQAIINVLNRVIQRFFEKGGWLDKLAQKHNIIYRERQAQSKMAHLVLNTLLKSNKKLVVEAPTGTGKTFAYLVPIYALSWAMDRTIQTHITLNKIPEHFSLVRYRTAVSTYTITLQKQIYAKDLPAIREIFREQLMFDASYSIAMGRNNYICRRQTMEYLSSLQQSISQIIQGTTDEEVIKRKQKFITYIRALVEEGQLDLGTIDELRDAIGEEYDDLFRDLQESIRSDIHNTLKKQCPFHEKCFYYQNKEKWHNADVLVMNHSLLTLALKLKPSYFNTINGIIVDEAHHLPEVIRDQLGRIDLSIYGIRHSVKRRLKRLRDIQDWLKGQAIPHKLQFLRNMSLIGNEIYGDYTKQLQEVYKKTTNLEMLIEKVLSHKTHQIVHHLIGKKGSNNGTLIIPIQPIVSVSNSSNFNDSLTKVKEVLSDIEIGVRNVADSIEELMRVVRDGYEKAMWNAPSGTEMNSLKNYIDVLAKSFKVFFSGYEESIADFIKQIDKALQKEDNGDAECVDFAYWIEIKRDNRYKGKNKYIVKLEKQAVSPEKLSSELLGSTLAPIVFTSATLTTLGSFDFFLSMLGLNNTTQVETHKLPPVFDYESQMEIFVPEDIPDVPKNDHNVKKANKYIDTLSKVLIEWLGASRGQALVLFTSNTMMRHVYERVEPEMRKKNIKIYMQDDGMSRDTLLKTFKTERYSVLFATKTFWEGIDVQGLSLQLLVITRLPFSNPTDLTEQALDICFRQENKNKFDYYDLPIAGMKLKQAVGRLIRSETDSGIIIITDTRLLPGRRRYSKLLADSLPVEVKPLTTKEITSRIIEKIKRD